MSKVYIVTSGDYCDYRIKAVFSTLKGAKQYKEQYADQDYIQIDDWIVDEPYESGPPGMKFYTVVMIASGDVESITVGRYDMNEEPFADTAWSHKTYREMFGNLALTPYDALRVGCWARNEEHATKIAGEKMAEAKARGEFK